MATYMTDTHSLLWLFMYPRKLGENARRAFDEVGSGEARLLIPVIVLAELIFTIENKPITASLDEILDSLRANSNIEFVALDFQSALKLRELTQIPEMHDRMIVASALNHDVSLITVDESIAESKLVDVVW
ncbi:MAG: PIN domain-containing protein [Anaerolineales bacterium]|nr:PIN domain-containing protein [Anaerolineales bacterium]